MTQERILNLAYYEALDLWAMQKDRQEKGKELGYETPIADHWVKCYKAEMKELEQMLKKARETEA